MVAARLLPQEIFLVQQALVVALVVDFLHVVGDVFHDLALRTHDLSLSNTLNEIPESLGRKNKKKPKPQIHNQFDQIGGMDINNVLCQRAAAIKEQIRQQ